MITHRLRTLYRFAAWIPFSKWPIPAPSWPLFICYDYIRTLILNIWSLHLNTHFLYCLVSTLVVCCILICECIYTWMLEFCMLDGCSFSLGCWEAGSHQRRVQSPEYSGRAVATSNLSLCFGCAEPVPGACFSPSSKATGLRREENKNVHFFPFRSFFRSCV